MIHSYTEPATVGDPGHPASSPRPPEVRKAAREEEADRKIEQTIAFMREHMNQSLPVARLAALANMSPSHYTALFKRRTGCAPIDFFIRLRMRQAGRLLDETTLNVKEVAAALGYDDPFYFSRTFKSVHGIAPREYRIRREDSSDRNLKPVRCVPPLPARLVQAAGNAMEESFLIGGFQTSARRPEEFGANRRESCSKPGQTCSIPVHP